MNKLDNQISAGLVSLRLVKHSIIYSIPGIIGSLVSFFLLPVYTRYLTPSDYGILGLLGATFGIVGNIVSIGLTSAAFREVIYADMDKRIAFSTGFWLMTISNIIVVGCLVLFAPNFSQWILGSLEWSTWFRIYAVSSVAGSLGIWMLVRCRIEQKPVSFAILSISSTALNTIFGITTVVILKLGVKGFIASGFGATLIISILYMIFIRHILRPIISFQSLKRMLKFGAPLVPANLSSLMLTSADRYFLKYFASLSEVGLYSIGYRFGMIMTMVTGSFQLAWPAEAFRIAKESESGTHFGRIFTHYIFALGFIALVLCCFAREIVILMVDTRFWSSFAVVPLIVLSYLCYGARTVVTIGVGVLNKTYYLAITIVIAAIINLVLNAILIPIYGMMGAAWATLISYIALLVMDIVVNQRLYPIRYELWKIGIIVLFGAFIFGMSSLVENHNIWFTIVLKTLLIILYIGLLLIPGFLSVSERLYIKNTIIKIRSKVFPSKTECL